MKGIGFDPHRRAVGVALRQTVNALTAYLTEREMALDLRKRGRRTSDHTALKLGIEATLCNLVVAKVLGGDGPPIPVEVWRSLSTIRHADPHRPEVYGKGLLDALDLMAHPEVGLIASSVGYRFEGTSRATEITARPALWFRVPPEAVDLESIHHLAASDVLVLKGPDGATMPLPKGPSVASMRKRVVELNARLRTLPITLERLSAPPLYGVDGGGRPVDPTQVTVRRYFGRGRMDRAGRLFGAYWEEMPRIERHRRLRLGGHRVVNVDYGQLYPRLACLVAGMEQPEGDLYAVPGLEGYRDGVKLITNALLFTEGELTAWPKGGLQAFPKGTTLREVVGSIAAKHPDLVPLFGSGIGHRLMFIESEMLMEVLEFLHRGGVPALPMHDAVIVPAPDGERAKVAMEEAFRMRGGSVTRGLVEAQGMAEFCGVLAL